MLSAWGLVGHGELWLRSQNRLKLNKHPANALTRIDEREIASDLSSRHDVLCRSVAVAYAQVAAVKHRDKDLTAGASTAHGSKKFGASQSSHRA
jgi:hypothetical protein